MAEKVETKNEALPDLDDLLQCPVCYEIPPGQIFQCNEGHHVCGRCKSRLEVCPVCRAMFFGTRNYAMEELISNVRKLRAFKLGGKVTTGTAIAESSSPAVEDNAAEPAAASEDDDDENNGNFASRPAYRTPQACKGLFRCLCCKNGNGERLPSARLLNHLRYYHAPELIEGHSENGEYLQAWQFSTIAGRIVTAVRVADMGIFFLTIEISNNSLCAWLTMAAAPWVAHEFCYTVTISGNDREAIFSDCVWSVRSCEGSLKKRGHCLIVNGLDARALVAPAAINGKLSVRRTPSDQLTQQTQPRAVLRVACRGNTREPARTSAADLRPVLQDIQNDVAMLSRAFANLGRETNALIRSDAELRTRRENEQRTNQNTSDDRSAVHPPVSSPPVPPNNPSDNVERQPLSRNVRRRMRQRLRAALNESQPPQDHAPAAAPAPVPSDGHLQNGASVPRHVVGLAFLQQPPVPPPHMLAQVEGSGPSNGQPQNGNPTRANKKRRRQRR